MTPRDVAGATLALRGLRKAYADEVAVDDISLDVAAGEFVTLLGPSGSGKTTTLNMVAGFATSDAGEILLDGNPIGRLPAHKRGIGMVFQHYALFPHMTVFENVAFPLKQRKRQRGDIRARVTAVLEQVRLGHLAERHPRQLSGGQQQRVALARAIVFEPSLLLMDEPLGALDKHLREMLQLEFKRIHRELGITFVYVTHDQEEAIALSDRIAVFNNGNIEQIGTPQDLYEKPATLFVAQFLGESNILRAQVASDDAASITLEDGDTVLRAPIGATAPKGQPCLLVLRPEQLQIRPTGGEVAHDENVVSATVARIDYLGSNRKVEVTLSSGQTCIVRQQSGAPSNLTEGDRVVVSWSHTAGVVLPPGELDPAIAEDLVDPLSPVPVGAHPGARR